MGVWVRVNRARPDAHGEWRGSTSSHVFLFRFFHFGVGSWSYSIIHSLGWHIKMKREKERGSNLAFRGRHKEATFQHHPTPSWLRIIFPLILPYPLSCFCPAGSTCLVSALQFQPWWFQFFSFFFRSHWSQSMKNALPFF